MHPSRDNPLNAFQFRLSRIFLVTLFVGLLSACLAHVVRFWPSPERIACLWVTCTAAAVAVVWTVVLCRRRRRVEIIGGRLLLCLAPRMRWWVIAPLLALAIALLAALTAITIHTSHAIWTTGIEFPALGMALMACFVAPVVWIVQLILHGVWRTGPLVLELRESGVSYGGMAILRWCDVARYRWQEGKYGDLLQVDSRDGRHLSELVLHRFRGTVEEMLAQFVPRGRAVSG